MKSKFIWGVLLLALFSLHLVTALSSEEKEIINACKKECRVDLMQSLGSCNSLYFACADECPQEIKECITENENSLDMCSKNCSLIFNQSSRNVEKCESYCKNQFNSRKLCSINNCKKSCYDSKVGCTDSTRKKYESCSNNCIYTAFNKNITCENGKYKAGDIFLNGCEICECKYSSLIECEKSPTCNFDDFSITKQDCEESNGFYQQLCKGPYFRLRCSSKYYCQCGGLYDYRCPEDYVCIDEFKVPNIPPTMVGYNNRHGQPIGNIGICAKRPLLESCGNGICEDLVCTGIGYYQAETRFNCPEDC